MTIPTTGPLAEAQPDPMDRSSSRSSSSSEHASSSESDSDSSPYASDTSSDSDRRSSSSSSSSSESESEDELPREVKVSKLGGEEENVAVDSSATDENSSEPMTIEETEDKEGQPETFGKVIGHHVKYGLVDKGKNEFEFLPKGWIRVLHVSGMPLYFHQETRVCTWSPPYSIGPKINVRKHEVPLSSIPCLKYWKELEKENFTTLPGIIDVQNGKSNPGVNKLEDIEEGEIAEDVGEKAAGNQDDGHLGGNEGLKLKNPQSVSTEENDEASALLDADSLREYCIKRFIIQKRTHAVFDSWRSRRAFKKSNRQTVMNGPQQALPGNPAVITLVAGPRGGAAAAAGSESGAAVTRRKVINPAGKSYVSILHDVVYFNQGVYPDYKFVKLADATNPFGATVVILGVEYASGYGASKRLAKINSAKGTLSILLPEYKNVLKIGEDDTSTADAIVPTSRQQNPSDPSTSAQDVPNNHQDCSHFDTVEVEDPRISSMSKTLAKPIPSQILTTCMQRNKHNFGASEVENSLKPHPTNRKRILYTMKLAEHEVTVECKNKRDGKQLASQMLLKKLHPLVTHWAGLLKLYEVSEADAARKKRHLAREVTKLQERKHGEGEGRCMNHALLRKLREEMLKAKKNQASPIPPFVVLSADVSLSPAMDSPVVAAEVKQDPVRGEEEGEIRDNLDYEPVSSESDSESSPTVPLFSAGSDFVIKEELVSDEEQENNQSSSNGYTRKVEGGRKRRRLEAN